MGHRHAHFQGRPWNFPKLTQLSQHPYIHPLLLSLLSGQDLLPHGSPQSPGGLTSWEQRSGLIFVHLPLSCFLILLRHYLKMPLPSGAFPFNFQKSCLEKIFKIHKTKLNISFLLYFPITLLICLQEMWIFLSTRGKFGNCGRGKMHTKVHILRSYVATCIYMYSCKWEMHAHPCTCTL